MIFLKLFFDEKVFIEEGKEINKSTEMYLECNQCTLAQEPDSWDIESEKVTARKPGYLEPCEAKSRSINFKAT